MRKILILLMMLVFAGTNVFSQTPNIKITALPQKTEVKAGEIINVQVTVNIPKPWYTYSTKEQIGPEGIGPTQTEINVITENLATISGKIKAPKPKSKHDSGFNMKVEYYEGTFVFNVPIKAKKDLNFSKDKLVLAAYMQLCDTARCLPPEDYKATVANKVYKGAELEQDNSSTNVNIDSAAVSNVIDTNAAISDTNAAADNASEKLEAESTIAKTESQQQIEDKRKEGVFSFLWFAMGAGALALLTPCVFPMIPITVSFFTKRAEKTGSSSVKDAFVYAIGIMFTFTGLGILLAAIFGATGIRDFASNGWVNMFIAAIFIIFALNLFGAFEIQLPTGLMNKLDKKSGESSGIISVLLMALTFSITSFTCTVPFVGSALIAASGGEWFYPILGMIGFSGVFAFPFFLLAIFPSFMKKLPKSGGWMNNIKVVMGFLEIAAAIKFISNADLVWSWGILSKELFLAIWVIICILIMLYILGFFRFSHDSKVDGVSASRVIWAIFFGSISFYLLTGMFGKTLGELDAFLPPAEYREIMEASALSSSALAVSSAKDLNITENDVDEWLKDYDQGIAVGKEKGLPIFVDFTGFTCTNCRWMEQNMFKRAEIENRMKGFVKVKLYTDRREEPYISHKKMQQELYGSIELPLYVIITPDGEHLGTKTFTRDMQEFVDFLDQGLATTKK